MGSEEQYALPLNDLLMVLRASSGQTYQVQADVPRSLLLASLRRERCHAEVMVAGGQVVTCVIRDQAGKVRLAGAEAFETVRSQEQLIWIVTPYALPGQGMPASVSASPWAEPQAPVPPLQASHVPWVGHPAPVKRQKTPELAAHLEDRRLRMIWLLIDGRRTVADLAALLQISQETVSEALTTLEIRGLIASSQS